MEEKRGFGMAASEPDEQPRRTPAWANPLLWAGVGGLLGAGMFMWSMRAGVTRAARARLPQAQAAAGQLAAAAKQAAASAQELAKDYVPQEPVEEAPSGPSADTLAAPVDPSQRRRRSDAGTAGRSLAVRTSKRDKGFGSASEVQDIRQRWDAPDVSYEAPVPWGETDMGRGVKQTGGLAIFFWLFGWALFRFTSNREKTF
ncbi:MAG: hypothetical protein HYZ75_16100 [Elusimicrobia bacterium]|nr:hypothetical protein [Elusimicrobiota bacterium]